MDAEVLINIGLNAGDVAKKLNDVTAAIVKCKAEQKLLNEQLKNGEITSVEYEQSMVAVKDEMSALTKEQKGLVAQQKILTEDSKSYADTLNGQRQRLNDLTKAYDSLDESMRDSSAGQAFRDQIREQSEAIQQLEEATNRHQRNVGNYPKTITSIIPGFDKMNGVLDKLGTSMEEMSTNGGKAFSNLGKNVITFGKAFITPPIAVITAVLSAIVLVVTKVVDAFKKNDDAMTALQRAFSVFQPVIDITNKAFEGLATVLAKVVTVAADAVNAVMSLIPGYKEAAAEADKLVVEQDKLEDVEREYTINSAKRNKDIAKLRDEAAASGDPSVRMKKMQEAINLEAKNLEDEKKIKEKQLELLEKKAKKEADTSDEMKNKIAAARAAMYKAEEAYYTGTRRLQAQLRSAQDEIAREEAAKAKAAADEAKRRNEEAKRRREERKRAEEQAAKEAAAQAKAEADTLAELQKQAEDMRIAAIKDADDKALQERMAAGNREIDELKKKYAEDKTLTAESREILNQIIIQKRHELDAQLEQMEADAFEAKKQAAADRAVEEQETIMNLRKDALAAKTAEDEADEIALEEERFQTQLALMQLQMQQELESLDLTEAEKQAIRDKYAAIELQAWQEYEDKKTEIKKKGDEARLKMAQIQMQAQADLLGNLGNALLEFGKDNEKAAKAAKILNVGKVMMESGVALAKGIAQSQAVPFPGNLAAMAATIAAITTNMAMALKQVEGAKFATGGIVPGTYDAKDSVRASLSGGEMVLNPAQQKRLFEVANVGMSESFDYERMAAAVAVGVSELPAPVLDYKEFTTFEDNVATVDELSRI